MIKGIIPLFGEKNQQMFWGFEGFSVFFRAAARGRDGGKKQKEKYKKIIDKASRQAYTEKNKNEIEKEGRNKSMAHLNQAMNYTFYFYFRSFTFGAGYFAYAKTSDSMSFCGKAA